ncbi:MAG: hypothetical protein ACLFTA_02085 [Candidatus Nanohaloarchaea archaeon]
MRLSITVVIVLMIALTVIAGVYTATETVFDSGGEEVKDTSGFFSGCMGGILSDSEEECSLFSEEGDEGG